MQFTRKGRGKFHSGEFTIVRPSGRKMSREPLEIIHPGHDYNFRFDGDGVWLLDDEREIGYAEGRGREWTLVFDGRNYALEQEKIGISHSSLWHNRDLAAEVGGGGFPLKVVELNRDGGLTMERQVFVVAVALLGWRESDRELMGAAAGVNGAGGG